MKVGGRAGMNQMQIVIAVPNNLVLLFVRFPNAVAHLRYSASLALKHSLFVLLLVLVTTTSNLEVLHHPEPNLGAREEIDEGNWEEGREERHGERERSDYNHHHHHHHHHNHPLPPPRSVCCYASHGGAECGQRAVGAGATL
eukprot:938269-Rhodomonas_salina.2